MVRLVMCTPWCCWHLACLHLQRSMAAFANAVLCPSRPTHPPTRRPPPAPPPPPPMQATLEQLSADLEVQQANAVAVEQRLQREKGSWVLENRAVVPREFLQVNNVQPSQPPRILSSQPEA